MSDNQELRRYFAMFLRWWWLIVICALLGGGAAYARDSQVVPTYKATTTLMVRLGGSGTEATNLYYGERLAQAYSKLVTSRPVMEAAAARLGPAPPPDSLAEKIEVDLVPDSGLMRLNASDVDPAQAAQIANAVADAFIVQNEAMQQERYADFLSSVRAQMEEMSALMEQTSAAVAAIGTPITDQEQAEVSRLETTLAGYRNTYAMLSNNYEQMRLTAALSADTVVVLETAEIPQEPVGGRTIQNTALAMAVGAMLAVGVAFLVEYLDDTIKTPDDVQQALGLDTLGIIGRLRKREGEMVVASEPRSPITEAYRALRTKLRFYSLDKPLRTILVTSPGVTEGKSVTVANLALAMAQSGLKVAAVDADLRRPRQHKLFDLEQSTGLTRSLLDGRLDGNLRPSPYAEDLRVLTSGELPPNPAELLGSRRMHDLLDELAAQVDVVIIDSPPLLPVTDAAVLAQHVDGVLLVLEAGRTRRGAAQHAAASLRQVGANVLGVVLNSVPLRKGGYYYYYYYYARPYGEGAEKRGQRRHKKGLLAAFRRRSRSSHRAAETRSGDAYERILNRAAETWPARANGEQAGDPVLNGAAEAVPAGENASARTGGQAGVPLPDGAAEAEPVQVQGQERSGEPARKARQQLPGLHDLFYDKETIPPAEPD